MAWTEAQISDLKRLGHRPIGGLVGQVKWHWINNGGNNLMKTLVLRLAGAPFLVMTLVAVVCSIAVADAADSTKIGTSTDGDADRHSGTDQGTGALKTDDLIINWDIPIWDWKTDTDQIAKIGLSGIQPGFPRWIAISLTLEADSDIRINILWRCWSSVHTTRLWRFGGCLCALAKSVSKSQRPFQVGVGSTF